MRSEGEVEAEAEYRILVAVVMVVSVADRDLKGSFLERRVFIEERLNVDRKDSKEEDRETEHEGPDVEVEVGTAPFDNVQKREHDRPFS